MRGIRVLLALGVLVAVWSSPAAGAGDRFVEGEVFAKGEIGTVNGIAFERDGATLYVTGYSEDPAGNTRAAIFAHRLADGAWGEGQRLWFSGDHTTYQPTLSPDGGLMFFVSKRPLPGTEEETRQNVWFVRRGEDGTWGEPQVVPELVSPHWDGHAMLTGSGWLYFASDRPGGEGGTDIYRCRFEEGHCPHPENVAALSSAAGDNDLYVDPEERFIVFQRSFDETRNLDLYFSVKRGGAWAPPRPIEALDTPDHWEMSPFATADCEWLYFDRFERGKPQAIRFVRLREALGFDPCAVSPAD